MTRKQLKLAFPTQEYWRVGVLKRCFIGIDKNSSHFAKLCKPVQLMHLRTNTLLMKERDLFCEL
jgi:hypothetical protein